MKKYQKLKCVLVLGLLVSLTAWAGKGGEGSTGTTGGGDYQIDPIQFLPQTAKVVFTYIPANQRYDQKEIVFGTERCWGIPGMPQCTIYAREVVDTFEFDRRDATQPNHGWSHTAVVRRRGESRTMTSDEYSALKSRWYSGASHPLWFAVGWASVEERGKALRPWLLVNAWVDGMHVVRDNRVAHDVLNPWIDRVGNKLSDSLVFKDPKTIAAILGRQEILNHILLLREGDEKGTFDVESILKKKLKAQVVAEGTAWVQQATRLASSERCDLAQAKYLFEQVREWDTASSTFFARLRAETGMNMGFLETSDAPALRRSYRGKVYEALQDCGVWGPSVTPASNATGELKEVPTSIDGGTSLEVIYEGTPLAPQATP